MRPVASFSPRPVASPGSSPSSGSVGSVHRERSRSPRTLVPPMAPAPVPGPVYPVPCTPMCDARRYRSLFSRHRVTPPTPPPPSLPPSDEKPSAGTYDPAAKLEGDPDEPYVAERVPYGAPEAYYSEASDGSERESASVDSAPSNHHSSGTSSGSASLGYGSASSGSASDGASNDDLVNLGVLHQPGNLRFSPPSSHITQDLFSLFSLFRDMRPIAPFSPRPAASLGSSASSGSVGSVHRERSRSRERQCRLWPLLLFLDRCTPCRVHRCAMLGDTVASSLVTELHLLCLLPLLLHLVTKSLLRERTTQQQNWKEISMSLMLLSEYHTEPPRHIILMPPTGQSARALMLVRHRPATILPAVLLEARP
ncbi:hypothetical protein PIB30_088400 [Stylosanthes scabra]|uniref:Uncharacterized protein n=1 Tax=Stylosanthes scabra TaxID=79078 RepID=A0ABU6ZSA4_9FABA|nr:hypothetical protein [Stylosanthes scabra]